jgi:hypothetical protein
MRVSVSTTTILFLLGTLSALADDPTPGEESAQNEPKKEVQSAVYVPPLRGKPRARVGGGVRSGNAASPMIYTLAPDHIGQTVSAQPSFFWLLRGELSNDVAFVFTLIDDAHIDPLVEAELPRPLGEGIQRIDLSGYGVRLEPGTEYEWSVALVVNAESRSNDVVAVGWIDRVEPPVGLGASPDARVFAANGLWYDALAAAADDSSLRDALLRDVGLGPVPPPRRD